MNKHVNEFKENIPPTRCRQSLGKQTTINMVFICRITVRKVCDAAATGQMQPLMQILSPVGGPAIQMATKVDYTGQKVKYEVAKPPVKGKKKAKAADEKQAVVGRRMKARLDPDDPIKGSLPSIAGNDAELYNRLTTGYATMYYKGHLLNDNLGGLGVRENLFPLTGAANHAHLEQVETPC